MKIYPDPELPDLEVEWFAEGDCRGGTGGPAETDEVALSLVGIDDAGFRADITVPCGSTPVTFADIARERYRVSGELRTKTGTVASSAEADLDLRNGLDARTSLYFPGISNLRVAWAFDRGESCASLAVEVVILEVSSASHQETFVFGRSCDASMFEGSLPTDRYTIVARATSGGTAVASSPPSAEIAVSAESLTDAGTLILSPAASLAASAPPASDVPGT